jgi:hypothetical protein
MLVEDMEPYLLLPAMMVSGLPAGHQQEGSELAQIQLLIEYTKLFLTTTLENLIRKAGREISQLEPKLPGFSVGYKGQVTVSGFYWRL